MFMFPTQVLIASQRESNSGKKMFSFLFNRTNVGIYLEVSRTIYLSVVVYLPIYLNESNKVIFKRMMHVLPARMEHTLEHSQAFCIFPKELGGS